MRLIFSSLILLISFTTLHVEAIDHVGRISKVENSSTIFVPFKGKEKKTDRLTKYLGKVYRIIDAKRGMRVDNGHIVNTGPHSKLKVIFKNGDHLYVSPNTQIEIKWQPKTFQGKDPSTISILRGAIRGLIEKDGPRSGMKVITTNTVMGVRGTDFHVSQLHSGLTQISVLRGKIKVFDDIKEQNVEITPGKTFVKKDNNSDLVMISQSELKQIKSQSEIKSDDNQTKEIQELEKKATEVTLKDIKIYQPTLYEKVIKMKGMDSEKLAASTIEILEKLAPATRKKPDWEDLIDDRDPYETYKPKNK